MVFGVNNKILTIAIPTWNRSEKLKESLDWLLPQIIDYKDSIELIISDNASTDNTMEILDNVKINYPNLDIKFNKQPVNTGFYGNFKKCIELASGKYLWLLSDDDFIFNGVIHQVMKILINNHIGAIFLKDWTSDKLSIDDFNVNFVNQKQFFSDRPYRHSLISSIIFRNKLETESVLFSKLKDNALLGYAVFLNAVASFNNFAVLNGNSLLARNDDEIRFNALDIFVFDLNRVIEYNSPKFNNEIISMIMNSFLGSLICGHFKDYKYNMKYKNSNVKNIKLLKMYFKYFNFWVHVFPVIFFNKKTYKKLVEIKNKL
jgi:abequosyltransferase